MRGPGLPIDSNTLIRKKAVYFKTQNDGQWRKFEQKIELGFLEKRVRVTPQMRGNRRTGLERVSKNGRCFSEKQT